MNNKALIGLLAGVVIIAIALGFSNEQEKRALRKQFDETNQYIVNLKKTIVDLQNKLAQYPKGVDNDFEVTAVKKGDRIGTMTIVSIKPFIDKQPRGKYNAIVQFKGEVALTGSWDRREFGGDKVCMNDLSAESKKRLPVQDGDTRAVWFCFDNDAMARTSFGAQGASGTATVIIDDYQYVSADADVWNSARLVRVMEKTTGKSSSAR